MRVLVIFEMNMWPDMVITPVKELLVVIRILTITLETGNKTRNHRKYRRW